MRTLYNPGDKLEDDQYLLVERPMNVYNRTGTGLLAKLTLKGAIPKEITSSASFYDHSISAMNSVPIYVFDEFYRPGWKLVDKYSGASQDWAIMRHPEGFTISIYLHNFMKLVLENTLVNGELQGEFMWKDKKLIKKP